MRNYFYGWYYRCQGKRESIAVIPAVHISENRTSYSVQLITENGSFFQEFPIEQFRINRKKGMMRIGSNVFSKESISLDLEVVEGRSSQRTKVCGKLYFGTWKPLKYDIMGPFALLPKMECRHTIYSMKHTVNGRIVMDDQIMEFREGVGYVEGDSGFSFPEQYVWMQHFLPRGSFMLAVASIPIGKRKFTGTIGVLCIDHCVYRFATYLGAVVKVMKEDKLVIRQGPYSIRISFHEKGGDVLKAPIEGTMEREVRENLKGNVRITVLYKNQMLVDEMTERAAVEYECVM